MPSIASIAIGGLMFLSLVANALPQITRSGRYLYEPDGTRFYIKVSYTKPRTHRLILKGVAYQPQGAVAEQSAANAEK
jgi:hypothetical protein